MARGGGITVELSNPPWVRRARVPKQGGHVDHVVCGLHVHVPISAAGTG